MFKRIIYAYFITCIIVLIAALMEGTAAKLYAVGGIAGTIIIELLNMLAWPYIYLQNMMDMGKFNLSIIFYVIFGLMLLVPWEKQGKQSKHH